MNSISLQKSTQKMVLREGQLLIQEHEKILEIHPVAAVEQISVYGNPQITTQAIKECLKEGVRINYFNIYGKYLGRLESGYPKNIRRRLDQYRYFFNSEKRLQFSKSLIKAKIQGQIVELRRLSELDFQFPFKNMRKELKNVLKKISGAGDLKTLLGLEGIASRSYFEVFQYVLPEGISWQGRSYHPPEDKFNCLLSAGYGFAAQSLREWIEQYSLDPHCSFLHEPGYGTGGLQYDLLEIFRAVFCDHNILDRIWNDPEIRSWVQKKEKENFLPESLQKKLNQIFRKKLHLSHNKQRYSPSEQMQRAIRCTIGCLNGECVADNFLQLLPER